MKEELSELLKRSVEKFGRSPVEKNILNGQDFNCAGYEIAIRRACIDLTPRTLNRKPDSGEKMPVDVFLDKDNPESFITKIIGYFSDKAMSKEEYDEWHNDICEKCILPTIRKYYTNKDKENSEVCYGKAQKIVNMTLKGCYCLRGAMTEYKNHFQYCHVALDGYTLAWYERHDNKVDKKWSYLDYDTYIQIQNHIREFAADSDIGLFNDSDLTPFQREFLIWPLEMMVNTVKCINSCYGGLISESYAEDYFKTYGMANDLKMAYILLGSESIASLDAPYVSWLTNDIPEHQTGKRASADHILSLWSIFNSTAINPENGNKK